MQGKVIGSEEAFPAETQSEAQKRFPFVRNSVGLSHNLRNNAVYDRRWDWALLGPADGHTRIEPATDEKQKRVFSWESRGSSLELLFRPRFYQRHKEIEHFTPWTYIRPALCTMAGGVLLVSDKVEVYKDDLKLEGMKRSAPVLFTVPGQLYDYPPRGLGNYHAGLHGGEASWWLLEIDRPFDANVLSGKSAVVVGDPYVMTVHLPEGFRIESAEVVGEKVETANRKETATIRIVPSATKTMEWRMTFAK